MKNNLRWLRRRDRTDRTGGGVGRRRRGLNLEILALEDRQMLSMVIGVTSAADSGPGTLLRRRRGGQRGHDAGRDRLRPDGR